MFCYIFSVGLIVGSVVTKSINCLTAAGLFAIAGAIAMGFSWVSESIDKLVSADTDENDE